MPDSKPMKIVGIMLVRNEDWVIGASLRAALEWCDEVLVAMHACDDKTPAIVHEIAEEVGSHRMAGALFEKDKHWNEMDMRQNTLAMARFMGATHIAIIDGDEILTHNWLPRIRAAFEALKPKQTLEVPMVAVWSDVDHHRVGDPVWSEAWLTLGFCDNLDLTWKPAGDGYQHHNRPPHGVTQRVRFGERGDGGVMHLQFANPRRLLAKHVLYRMVDHLRWPGRESVEQLNWKYDQALRPGGRLEQIPESWWGSWRKDLVSTIGVPYQESEVLRLVNAHGRRAFEGLDLKGFA